MLPTFIKRARRSIHSHCHSPTSCPISVLPLVHSNQRFSTASSPPPISTAPSTSTPSAPERLLIVGCGISGLSLAHFLQHLHHPPHIPRPHIRLVDSQPRSGGWIDTHLPSAHCPYLFERGPRSLLTRRGDSTLALIHQLRLHDDIVVADVASKRRYVWDSKQHKLVLLPTGVNSSLFRFPYLAAIVRGAWHELRTPARRSEEDESVAAFIARRFNGTVADELIDPLAAGIYTGNTQELSLRSCFPVLHTAEQQSGSVVRHLIRAPAVSSEWLEGEEQLQAEEWVKAVKRNGTYSFAGGMRMLTDRLTEEVEAAGEVIGQGRVVRLGASVERLVLSETGVTAVVNGVEEQYDRVISTVSATSLSRILNRTTHSSQPSTTDSHHSSSQQPSTIPPTDSSSSVLQYVDSRSSLSFASLLSSLSTSLSSLPYANVWVVNLAYPTSVLRTPAFGLLCASHHSTEGLLGIAFDSCVFPQHNTAHTLAQPATRLTVMLGGARFPHLTHSTAASVQSAAVAAVADKLGVSVQPLWVEARLAMECIPQYVVGHSRWVASVESGVEAVNGRLGGERRRLDVLGNAMYGVSVNDLISRAKLFAAQYYRGGRVKMSAAAADSGSEAGILPVAAGA